MARHGDAHLSLIPVLGTFQKRMASLDIVLPEAHSHRWTLRGLDTTFSSPTPDKLTENTAFYGGPPPLRSHRRDEATSSSAADHVLSLYMVRVVVAKRLTAAMQLEGK